MWMLNFWSWLGRAEQGLQVDYAKQPKLPNGAARVLRHVPAGSGVVTLNPSDMDLRPMPQGMTYDEYYAAHKHERLGDVMILDAMVAGIMDRSMRNAEIRAHFRKYLGHSFVGQIFFLGTSFQSEDGRECVPYLNLNTHQPAIRYICPSAHPINHTVNCCACHLQALPTA